MQCQLFQQPDCAQAELSRLRWRSVFLLLDAIRMVKKTISKGRRKEGWDQSGTWGILYLDSRIPEESSALDYCGWGGVEPHLTQSNQSKSPEIIADYPSLC